MSRKAFSDNSTRVSCLTDCPLAAGERKGILRDERNTPSQSSREHRLFTRGLSSGRVIVVATEPARVALRMANENLVFSKEKGQCKEAVLRSSRRKLRTPSGIRSSLPTRWPNEVSYESREDTAGKRTLAVTNSHAW